MYPLWCIFLYGKEINKGYYIQKIMYTSFYNHLLHIDIRINSIKLKLSLKWNSLWTSPQFFIHLCPVHYTAVERIWWFTFCKTLRQPEYFNNMIIYTYEILLYISQFHFFSDFFSFFIYLSSSVLVCQCMCFCHTVVWAFYSGLYIIP